MRFTTLGTGTVALSATRSCAGYLAETAGFRLLIDCGSGVVRRLAERGRDWQTISHVALTHFHIDHHGDLPTLIFAWKYGMLPARSAPLEIIGPVGTRSLLDRLTAAYGDWVGAPGFAVNVREVEPGAQVDLGGAVLSTFKVPHTAESVAYSVTRGSRRIVYTGDTGVSPELGTWAKGCDLLIAECSLPTDMAIPEHLTPEQAGALGLAAEPRMLALTHFYPPVERVDIIAEVRRNYAGPLTLTHDGWVSEIEEH